METQFEIKGYSVNYYVGTKFIGSVSIDTPDREEFGYTGRHQEVLTQDVVIGKKVIKKGTLVKTELQKICGRIK